MRGLPKIALAVSIPPIVWRAETGFVHDDSRTAADVLRYEQRTRGHGLDISTALIDELRNYPAAALLWVTFTRADALRYGHPAALIELRWNIPAFVLATDDAGGFLLFSPDESSQPTGGAAMAHPMNTADKGFFAVVMAKVTEVVTHALGNSSPPPIEAAPASPAIDDEDERKRRAGHGAGDMGNPAHAQLAANIRPEIVSTPDGTATITTAKSSQYDANPEERAASQKAGDYIRDLLARAQDSATKETDAPTVAPVRLDNHSDPAVPETPVQLIARWGDAHEAYFDAQQSSDLAYQDNAFENFEGSFSAFQEQRTLAAAAAFDDLYAIEQKLSAAGYVEQDGAWAHASSFAAERATERMDEITTRQNAESATRQEAELDARNAGISTPEPAASGSSYLKDLLSRADNAKRDSEGAEVVTLAHSEGHTPTGGGRGIS